MQRIGFDGKSEDFIVTPEMLHKGSKLPFMFQCKSCAEYGNGRGCENDKGGCDDKCGKTDRWYEISTTQRLKIAGFASSEDAIG